MIKVPNGTSTKPGNEKLTQFWDHLKCACGAGSNKAEILQMLVVVYWSTQTKYTRGRTTTKTVGRFSCWVFKRNSGVGKRWARLVFKTRPIWKAVEYFTIVKQPLWSTKFKKWHKYHHRSKLALTILNGNKEDKLGAAYNLVINYLQSKC
jgi:hypothetical protein